MRCMFQSKSMMFVDKKHLGFLESLSREKITPEDAAPVARACFDNHPFIRDIEFTRKTVLLRTTRP